VAAIERAIDGFEALGDEAAVGRCTRVLSRFHWYAGNGEAARGKGLEAIAVLQRLGGAPGRGRAYSGLSRLAMLADEPERAVEWGEEALALATQLGDEATRTHALINIGSAEIQLDPGAVGTLLEAHAIADAAGQREDASRALSNLAYSLVCWV